MSYGLLCGRVGDHNVDPYASHITSITGREIAADKLGLLRSEAAAAAHPDWSDGAKPPPTAVTAAPAAEAAAAHADAAAGAAAPAAAAVPAAAAAAPEAPAVVAAEQAAVQLGGAHFTTPMVDMSA